MFDTVFTSIGSTTQIFRVHNPNNGEINISSISLARGSASFYKLNVDGVAGTPGAVFTNLQIAAKDSMYIFVQVNINPNANPSVSPFIYRDSIVFEVNGNKQYFSLIAFGQNAYYHMPNQKLIMSNTQALYYSLDTTVNGLASVTWKNDKPHLIYGYLVVDSLHTLTIPPGTKVYVHNGGGIWVYRYGTIKINGVQTNTVSFQGDRLEQAYDDVPGQWDRIWINEGSTGNVINYAHIKNAYIGVHAGVSIFDGLELPWAVHIPPTKLSLTNTIIENASYAGLLAHDYTVTGGNDLIVNCGQHICEFDYGGNYSFYQCTFANYWNQTNNSQSPNNRTTPSFLFNNYYNGNQLSAFDSVYFGNCIFDGSLTEEFKFDTLSGSSSGFNLPYFFDHCALKTAISISSNHMNASIIITPSANQMVFNNPATYDFHISVSANSAAKGSGNPIYVSSPYNWYFDLENNARNSPPDLGVYVIK